MPSECTGGIIEASARRRTERKNGEGSSATSIHACEPKTPPGVSYNQWRRRAVAGSPSGCTDRSAVPCSVTNEVEMENISLSTSPCVLSTRQHTDGEGATEM